MTLQTLTPYAWNGSALLLDLANSSIVGSNAVTVVSNGSYTLDYSLPVGTVGAVALQYTNSRIEAFSAFMTTSMGVTQLSSFRLFGGITNSPINNLSVALLGDGRVVGVAQFTNAEIQFVEGTTDLGRPKIVMDDGNLGFRSGSFGFTLLGETNMAVVVERSTNLVDWTPFPPVTLPEGSLYFSDPEPAGYGLQFYRARTQ